MEWPSTIGGGPSDICTLGDEVIDDKLEMTLGSTTLELYSPGPADTPGDAVFWIPAERLVIAGHIIHTERLPSARSHSRSGSRLKIFEP